MICTNCDGFGYQSFHEDDRLVEHPCYHCGTSGKVDEETYHQDQLAKVADEMAYYQVLDYKRAVDNDPEGDGWGLYAAESMMSQSDYFDVCVFRERDRIIEDLTNLSRRDQDILIAWNSEQW